MELKPSSTESVSNTNNNGNEADYLLYQKNTWQCEEEMLLSFTEQYLASLSYVETIKIEGEEDDYTLASKSKNICIEGETIIFKKKDGICDNVHAALVGFHGWRVVHDKKKHLACDQCERLFRTKPHLKQHKLLNESIKYFACDQCEKSFKQKHNLKQHKLIHEGIKSFACNQCGKKFMRKGDLKTHNLIHDGIKSFTCNQCEKRFTLKHHLNQHKLLHENVKPFACEQCENRFTQKGNLKRHKLTHEGT